MAAIVTGRNPRVVTSADGAVVQGQTQVLGVYWIPSAVSQTVTLQDDAGDIIWTSTLAATSPIQPAFFVFPVPILVNGHKVSTITAGSTLLLYLR